MNYLLCIGLNYKNMNYLLFMRWIMYCLWVRLFIDCDVNYKNMNYLLCIGLNYKNMNYLLFMRWIMYCLWGLIIKI